MKDSADDDDSVTTFGQWTAKDDYRSVNLLEDDDDEHDESDSPREQKAPPSKEGKKSPRVSPATQTLNILSQNMDDLRYNMTNSIGSQPESPSSAAPQKIQDEIHRQAKTSPIKLSPDPSGDGPSTTTKQHELDLPSKGSSTLRTPGESIPQDIGLPPDILEGWEAIPVRIQQRQGSLGLVVVKDVFPEVASGDHCRVKSLGKRSLAEKAGIQVGDWICRCDQSEKVTLIGFDAVQEIARRRPFQACVLRKKVTDRPVVSTLLSPAQKPAAPVSICAARIQDASNGKKAATRKLTSTIAGDESNSYDNSSIQAEEPRRPKTKPERKESAMKTIGLQRQPRTASAVSQTDTNNPKKGEQTRKSSLKLPDSSDESAGEIETRRQRQRPAESVASRPDTNKQTTGNQGRLRYSRPAMLDSSDESAGENESPPIQASKCQGSIHNAGATGTHSRQGNANQRSSLPLNQTQLSKESRRKGARKPREEVSSIKSSARKRNVLSERNAEAQATKTNSESDQPKFCLRCNSSSVATRSRMHHAWCHLNEFYGNSGAMDLMERIRQGRKLNCRACKREFEIGKRVPKSVLRHTHACIQNQKRLKKQIEDREEEEQRKEQEENQRRREQTRKQQRHVSNPLARQLSPSSSEGEEDDDPEEESIYQPKRRFQEVVAPSSAGEPRRAQTSHSNAREHAQLQLTARPHSPPEASTDRTATRAKPQWTPAVENPWGPAGYAVGDSLLYGPLKGIGYVDADSCSRRCVVNPFTAVSNYRTTHVIPEEGLTVLSLRRDSLASQPWGFRVTIDEFEQACLVASVDALSPAASATLLGTPEQTTRTGLRVNDMILLVNGRPVGGMTLTALVVEIEASGPALVLAISRYRHSQAATRKFVAMEQQILDAMDSVTRDRSMIGWVEVGDGSPEKARFDSLDCDEPSQGDPVCLLDNNDDLESVEVAPPSCGAQTFDDNPTVRRDTEHESMTPDNPSIQTDWSDPRNRSPRQDRSPPKNCSKCDDSGSEDWEDDDNAWLGCVCGRVHSKAKKDDVFWIQCDSCQSWFDVSKKCVGFDMKEAEKVNHWTCWACPPQPEVTRVAVARQGEANDEDDVTDPAQARQGPTSPAKSVDKRREIGSGVTLQLPAQQEPSNVGECEASEDASTSSDGVLSRGNRRLEMNVSSRQELDGSQAQSENDHSEKSRTPAKKDTPPTSKKRKRERGKELEQLRLERTTAEGCVLPRTLPPKRSDGTYPKPAGRAFAKMVWDPKMGHWKPLRKARKRISSSSGASSGAAPATTKAALPELDIVDKTSTTKPAKRKRVPFNKGVLVRVKPHSWPGKNCCGGVGKVLESYADEDGDVFYKVKYVLGGSDKDIDEKFVKAYSH